MLEHVLYFLNVKLYYNSKLNHRYWERFQKLTSTSMSCFFVFCFFSQAVSLGYLSKRHNNPAEKYKKEFLLPETKQSNIGILHRHSSRSSQLKGSQLSKLSKIYQMWADISVEADSRTFYDAESFHWFYLNI